MLGLNPSRQLYFLSCLPVIWYWDRKTGCRSDASTTGRGHLDTANVSGTCGHALNLTLGRMPRSLCLISLLLIRYRFQNAVYNCIPPLSFLFSFSFSEDGEKGNELPWRKDRKMSALLSRIKARCRELFLSVPMAGRSTTLPLMDTIGTHYSLFRTLGFLFTLKGSWWTRVRKQEE